MFHVHCTLFADFNAAAAINALSQIDVEHIIRSGCNTVHWTAICFKAAATVTFLWLGGVMLSRFRAYPNTSGVRDPCQPVVTAALLAQKYA
jgi:hypothetical protein